MMFSLASCPTQAPPWASGGGRQLNAAQDQAVESSGLSRLQVRYEPTKRTWPPDHSVLPKSADRVSTRLYPGALWMLYAFVVVNVKLIKAARTQEEGSEAGQAGFFKTEK